jgi:two-component system phosphate regulon sensor histidine kinase PhoR
MGGKRLFSLVFLPFLLLPGGALLVLALLTRNGLPAEAQAALDRLLWVGGALALGLSLLAGWWVAHRLRRGLDALRSGMQRHGAGELGWRIPHQPVAALQEVAHAETTLVEQVDARLADAMRRLTEQEAVLSSMSEGVLAVDHGLRILNLNPGAGRMFGVPPADARGRTLLEVSRHNELLHFATAALEASAPTEGEIVIHDPDPRYLQAHGSVLRDAQGRSIGAVVVLNDVTALRRLETMRRDFVANVSHELKTPITSIKGFVETLLEGAMRDPKETERFLRIVQRQSERLHAIIEDLLNLSRIERDAEAGDIALEQGALKSVLAAALQSCETQARTRGVRLESECDAGLTAWINAPLLEQALVNLIDNAVKYSPAGGAVRVEAAGHEGTIAIRVRDEGLGIEARHLPRLFERFYRVDKARSRKLGGTGLGLAIVKHIAQAHRGQVTVESAPGQGSTFTLRLPVQPRGLSA